ncbi:hypothetical protein MNBD_IGNAVI01-494 [hydrothermal vent metagenome]|uniref:Uncharacterized protein n=1 Tax=hydrothermal vent metagenome TaxID=652676 RepID=A0A3B1CNP1_9ZZZZ
MNCPILNKTQKRIRLTGFILIAIAFIVWLAYGAEIFTKTQVLIEIQDELFGPRKEWQDHFIWGLDLTLLISVIVIIVTVSLLFLTRTKDKNIKNIN